MLAVLLGLVVLFSVLTIGPQSPEGAGGGRNLAKQILDRESGQRVFIVAHDTELDRAFAAALADRLERGGAGVAGQALGKPHEIRKALADAADAGVEVDIIACSPPLLTMPVFIPFVGDGLLAKELMAPTEYTGSDFLNVDNLRNVGSQIAVIAILAVGMTMVILTAGIDLSVGSLIALAAVVAASVIQSLGGADGAGVGVMILASLIAIAACALAGAINGVMVTGFCIPPFIATLGMMLVVRGSAFKIAANETISDVPASYEWLGNGASFGVPNCVILMLVLYLAAHLVMGKTVLGRYIYAVGNNPQAARYSAVPVRRIKFAVYVLGGALAGVGGVVMASQLQSGAGRYGDGYELKVIAAVVVGGTSLFGGKGTIFGTLIGAFIIAVIENGMNLKKLGSETQMIVLGAVILFAVLLERLRSGEWRSAVGG